MHTPPTSTELTYPRSLVGVSTYLHRLADLPDLAERLETSGFHTLSRTEVIGHGHADMSRAIDNLLSGRAHRRAGAPLRREPEKSMGTIRWPPVTPSPSPWVPGCSGRCHPPVWC